MATLHAQDLAILLEGPGSARDTAVRDCCAGAAIGGALGVASLLFTSNFLMTVSGQTVLNPGPTVALVIHVLVTVTCAALARLTHLRVRADSGRKSYCDLVKRLSSDLEPTQGKAPEAQPPAPAPVLVLRF